MLWWDAWWERRRPEIVEDFEREVFGRVPKRVPAVAWTVVATTDTTVGGYPVLGRQLTGHVDNSAYPATTVDIQMIVVTPADVTRPVPVMMMFGGRGLPGLPGFTPSGGPPSLLTRSRSCSIRSALTSVNRTTRTYIAAPREVRS